MISEKSLDLDTVRAFVLVADFASFTRAADTLGAAQGAISLKVKKLEDRLGFRLLDRTPRRVRLTAKGALFLEHARSLLAAHDRALTLESGIQPRSIAIGVSDHVAGPELPSLLRKLNDYDPTISLEITIDASRVLLDAFEHGRFDAIVFRRDHDHSYGTLLFEEKVSWLAAPSYRHLPDQPLHLAMLSTACGLRNLATVALDQAGISWRETFIGGGVAALSAAVSAGLAVTVLANRLMPVGTREVDRIFGLPDLPNSKVAVKRRNRERKTNDALDLFLTAFKSAINSEDSSFSRGN